MIRHYVDTSPGEVEALGEALGGAFNGCLLVPFFEEGGRYTVNDVHYVANGDWLVPVGETEFARDSVFGFRASNLRQWVEEKDKRKDSGALGCLDFAG